VDSPSANTSRRKGSTRCCCFTTTTEVEVNCQATRSELSPPFFDAHARDHAKVESVGMTALDANPQLTDESERSDDDAPTVNGRVRPRATKQDALVEAALQLLTDWVLPIGILLILAFFIAPSDS